MTKTAEQVVAEALGIHADHPDMWDLEARDVVNALREAGMLRDARPLINREKLIDVLVMTDLSDFAGTDMGLINQCADAVIAHLDVGTVDDSTEWEYGYTSKSGKTVTTSRENAERLARLIREEIELGRSSGDLRYHGKVIRRKASKAGEWEEIPNE